MNAHEAADLQMCELHLKAIRKNQLPPRLVIASRLLAQQVHHVGIAGLGTNEVALALEAADALLAAHAETDKP